MEHSEAFCSDLLDELSFALCIVKRDYRIVRANRFFQTKAIFDSKNMQGANFLEIFQDSASILKPMIDGAFANQSAHSSSWKQHPHLLPFQDSQSESGKAEPMFQNVEVIPLHNTGDHVEHVCICVYDVTKSACQQQQLTALTSELEAKHQEQKNLYRKLETAQVQLIQSEKMASIGQLSAGIAHEINNPVGFITSNIQTLKSYLDDITAVITELRQTVSASSNEALIADCEQVLTRHQVDYILEDTADLIDESLEGSSRVISIVKNLKEFSHLDGSEWSYAKIENCIDSTLKIINNEIKYKITVEKEYEDNLPDVFCQPMQINQVLLNLFVNASQAIDGEGEIFITVKKSGTNIEIKIRDTGAGIPAEIKDRIFEPFFTTKAVGSGTGLGLSVSYGIIQTHKGMISVESEVGKGSEFTIVLPIEKQVIE